MGPMKGPRLSSGKPSAPALPGLWSWAPGQPCGGGHGAKATSPLQGPSSPAAFGPRKLGSDPVCLRPSPHMWGQGRGKKREFRKAEMGHISSSKPLSVPPTWPPPEDTRTLAWSYSSQTQRGQSPFKAQSESLPGCRAGTRSI